MPNLLLRMAPTQDFTNTPKAGKTAIAVRVSDPAASGAKSWTLHSPVNDEDVVFWSNPWYEPAMTDEVAAGTDAATLSFVYFYAEEMTA